MSEPDAQAQATAAWRTFSRAIRGQTEPGAIAEGLPDRHSLEREVASAELALIWFRALAEACQDRLDNDDLPEVQS
jgi:hypothetical protein